MSNWLRAVLAVVAGFVAWLAVATVGNLGLRWLIAGYSEVESAMEFSSAMFFVRLILGAVASVAAGAACIVIARNVQAAVYAFALLLVVLFVPVHIGLWGTFPVWYHIVFLGSLFPLAMLGANLMRARGASAA